MFIKVVGIDIAKNLFQLCVLHDNGQSLSNRKVKRDKILDSIRQRTEQTVLAMESCPTSHHWGSIFQELGYTVPLIPAQHVNHLSGGKRTTPMIQELFAKPFLDLTFVSFLLNLLSNKTSKRYAVYVTFGGEQASLCEREQGIGC